MILQQFRNSNPLLEKSLKLENTIKNQQISTFSPLNQSLKLPQSQSQSKFKSALQRSLNPLGNSPQKILKNQILTQKFSFSEPKLAPQCAQISQIVQTSEPQFTKIDLDENAEVTFENCGIQTAAPQLVDNFTDIEIVEVVEMHVQVEPVENADAEMMAVVDLEEVEMQSEPPVVVDFGGRTDEVLLRPEPPALLEVPLNRNERMEYLTRMKAQLVEELDDPVFSQLLVEAQQEINKRKADDQVQRQRLLQMDEHVRKEKQIRDQSLYDFVEQERNAAQAMIGCNFQIVQAQDGLQILDVCELQSENKALKDRLDSITQQLLGQE